MGSYWSVNRRPCCRWRSAIFCFDANIEHDRNARQSLRRMPTPAHPRSPLPSSLLRPLRGCPHTRVDEILELPFERREKSRFRAVTAFG
jgi:hypothetical protein